jgi:hypothetical protein
MPLSTATAGPRALLAYVLCLKAGGLLPGRIALPEFIRQNNQEHIDALQHAHETSAGTGVSVCWL